MIQFIMYKELKMDEEMTAQYRNEQKTHKNVIYKKQIHMTNKHKTMFKFSNSQE